MGPARKDNSSETRGIATQSCSTLQAISGWAGLTWGGLPYESSLGAVWRFAWRNALSANDVWGLSGLSPGKVYPPPFWGATLRDYGFQRFTESTGLMLPMPDEWRLIGGKGSVGQILRGQLAFCPICAESAYHTFFFQIPFLNVCPIHNVPLSMHCMSCGAPSPAYAFSRDLFQFDWGCARCHEPIAGAAPDLLEFLDLLENSQALKTALDSLAGWVEEVDRSSAGFDCLTQCPLAPYRYTRALFESAVCAVRRPPSPSRATHFRVHCLNWHLRLRPPRPDVRIHHTTTEGLSFITEWIEWHCRRFPRTRDRGLGPPRKSTGRLVYEATIRRIRQWLLERHARLGLATDLRGQLRFENGRVATDGWDTYELAYLLLRFWWEGLGAVNCTLADETIDGRVISHPTFSVAGDRVLRIPLRIAILASYGTVTCMVGASKLSGGFSSAPSREHMESALSYAWQTNYLHHMGLVIMPAVEDLITWFPEIRSRVNRKWSHRWTGLPGGPDYPAYDRSYRLPSRPSPLP